ncbi:hypothetical protein Tco_1369595, partial [Tanacetum coccineum]
MAFTRSKFCTINCKAGSLGFGSEVAFKVRVRAEVIPQTTAISNIKLPILKKEEYDIWAMEMEHYLEYIDNEVWKVIQNGNSKKRISTGKDGIVRVLSPVTAAEIQAVEKERKAKNILLMAIPKEHMRRFHGMDDAKEIWEAIRTRFGGNANSKKMQKAIFKQQFEAFKISNSEGLEKGYDRFQQLLSQLEAHGAIKFKSASKTSQSQNVAFVSQSKSSTNKVKSGFTGAYSTCTPSTSSTNIPEKEIYLEQINDVDIEEMDINWQIAMIDIRMKKFYKKTGRRVRVDGKTPVGFDKKKLECFNWKLRLRGLLILVIGWKNQSDEQLTGTNINSVRPKVNAVSPKVNTVRSRQPDFEEYNGNLLPLEMPDENQILLKVPRHHNMYIFDMKTPTLAKGFACLIAKATSDESKLWHRRSRNIEDVDIDYHTDSYEHIPVYLTVNTGRLDPDDSPMPKLEIFHKSETEIFDEDKYVAEILKKFDLVNVKATITPMETKVPLTKDKEAIDVDVHLLLTQCYQENLQVSKANQTYLGLWYPRESPFDLEAFSDSDYGGSNFDRKSITDEVFDVSSFSATDFEYLNGKQTPLSGCDPNQKIFRNMKRGFRGAPRPLLPAMLLVATTNPNAGQEHHAVAQSQPPPIPTPTPPPIPTPTPPPILSPTPPPIPSPTQIPDTEPTPFEHTYEESSPVHHHFSPPQEQAPSQMPMDDLLHEVPKLISRIDSLEMDLKQTKLTMGNAIVKLVKKVKKMEGFLKRRNLVLTDSEEEEPEAQGRKSQDDPLDSSVQGLVTPPTTKVDASGEEPVEDI